MSLVAHALDAGAPTRIDSFLEEGLDGHLPRLRSVGRRITGCDDLAAEAVQEALIRLWQLAGDAPADVGGWLMHAVVHRSLHLRRTRVRRTTHEARAARRDVADLDPSDVAYAHEVAEILGEAMRALPQELREVLTLRCVDGLEYVAIAVELAIPVGTVRSRLNRARHQLVGLLGPLALDLDCPICVAGVGVRTAVA